MRLYDFMSQVFDYGTSDLEKLSEFLRQLTRLLPSEEAGGDVDVSGLELRRVRQIDQGKANISLSGDQDTPGLRGITGVGSGVSRQDPQQELLSEVVARINALFGADRRTHSRRSSTTTGSLLPRHPGNHDRRSGSGTRVLLTHPHRRLVTAERDVPMAAGPVGARYDTPGCRIAASARVKSAETNSTSAH
ncbi:hypothetical protein [Nocardia farcinica]|uniref:hypothetical protein n=1 Tax=Nocardia farcinica TaxID=37329 RepID=UPI0024582FD9|nr:hypothetical protein [Nocardia farcinica]